MYAYRGVRHVRDVWLGMWSVYRWGCTSVSLGGAACVQQQHECGKRSKCAP